MTTESSPKTSPYLIQDIEIFSDDQIKSQHADYVQRETKRALEHIGRETCMFRHPGEKLTITRDMSDDPCVVEAVNEALLDTCFFVEASDTGDTNHLGRPILNLTLVYLPTTQRVAREQGSKAGALSLLLGTVIGLVALGYIFFNLFGG